MSATPIPSNAITLTITSDAEQVSLLCEAIHALCLYASNSVECAVEVQQATVEALNNVLIHSYHNEPGHELTVRWSQTGQQLRVDIMDQGASITVLPVPELPDFSVESSRGWWIINACVDEYFYQVIDTVEQKRIYRPGGNSSEQVSGKKSHTNILTLLKNV